MKGTAISVSWSEFVDKAYGSLPISPSIPIYVRAYIILGYALCALAILKLCWPRYPETLVGEERRKSNSLVLLLVSGFVFLGIGLLGDLEGLSESLALIIPPIVVWVGLPIVIGIIGGAFLISAVYGLGKQLIGLVHGAAERSWDRAIGLVAGHDGSRKMIHEHLHTLKTARGRARYVAWLDGERFVPAGDWPDGWPPNFLDAASSHLAQLEQRWRGLD
jgi:hypothetical protein